MIRDFTFDNIMALDNNLIQFGGVTLKHDIDENIKAGRYDLLILSTDGTATIHRDSDDLDGVTLDVSLASSVAKQQIRTP